MKEEVFLGPDLTGIDMILGLPWFNEVNSDIDGPKMSAVVAKARDSLSWGLRNLKLMFSSMYVSSPQYHTAMYTIFTLSSYKLVQFYL